MAAAGSFAAISTVFGSPVIGAVDHRGGRARRAAVLSVVLLLACSPPGIGLARLHRAGDLVGVEHERVGAQPVPAAVVRRARLGRLRLDDPLAAARPSSCSRHGARPVAKRVVDTRLVPLTIVAGLVVGGLAIAFARRPASPTERCSSRARTPSVSLFDGAPNLSLSTLALLLALQGVAWSISLGNFRGGPTFPALFLGAVAGLIAGHLPGLAETQAVAALDRRRLRLDPASSAVLGDDRAAAHDQRRARRRTARGGRGRRRVPRERGPDGVRRLTDRGGAGAGRRGDGRR